MSVSAGSLSPAVVLVQEEPVCSGVVSPPAVRTKEGPKYEEIISLLTRLVKEERDSELVQENREWDSQMSPVRRLNEEAEAVCNGAVSRSTARVKDEPEWDVGDCRASENLYADHEVKSELVLGPVRLQPQDIAYEPQYFKMADMNHVTTAAVKSAVKQHEFTNYPCSACPKIFRSQLSLYSHSRIHKKRYYHFSKRKKANVNKLEKEQRHINSTERYSCNVCDKYFFVKHTFLKHKQIGSPCWFQGT